MTTPIRYSQDPIELPLEPWLLEGSPVPGCEECATRAEKRDRARNAGDWKTACAAARGIRNHRRGHQETVWMNGA